MTYANSHSRPEYPDHVVGDHRSGVPNRADHPGRTGLYYNPNRDGHSHTGFEAGAL